MRRPLGILRQLLWYALHAPVSFLSCFCPCWSQSPAGLAHPTPRVRVSELAGAPGLSPNAKRLQAEIQKLEAALDGLMDEKTGSGHRHGTQSSADLATETVWLRKAVCATGSGKILLSDNRKSWRFNTPKGQFEIRRKVVNPIWEKPEWAFVEAGLETPVLPWDFRRLDPVHARQVRSGTRRRLRDSRQSLPESDRAEYHPRVASV